MRTNWYEPYDRQGAIDLVRKYNRISAYYHADMVKTADSQKASYPDNLSAVYAGLIPLSYHGIAKVVRYLRLIQQCTETRQTHRVRVFSGTPCGG
jgi:hypothetical protein